MRRLIRSGDDSGNIVIALIAILVVSGVLTLGLATIVRAQLAARHDVAFESALAGAERGLSELVAQVRSNPTAGSFTPISGTTSQGVAYTATATAASGGWLVDATGQASTHGRTVTRHIQSTVSVDDLLDVALFGKSALNLGSGAGSAGSGVDRYDSSVSSDVCTSAGTQTTMITSDTRMCTQSSPALGTVATDGALTMKGTDLTHINEADIFNAPYPGYSNAAATGQCTGDTTVCASSKVVKQQQKLDYPLSTMCSNGIGGGATAYDGSTALAANAVYSFTDVTLNATAIANLANVSSSRIIICFNGTLTVPPMVPLNSTTSTTNSLLLAPRPPSTLLLVSTAPPGSSAPVVNLGAGLTTQTSLSAVVYAPNADCTATGHVDVYGLLVCGSVNAAGGLNVHYDTQIASLSQTGFDRPVTVSHWREVS